jgi:hypothetical protein
MLVLAFSNKKKSRPCSHHNAPAPGVSFDVSERELITFFVTVSKKCTLKFDFRGVYCLTMAWSGCILQYVAVKFSNCSFSDLSSLAVETDLSPSIQQRGRNRHKLPMEGRLQLSNSAASTPPNSDQPNLHPLPVLLTTDMR